jgi:hypothetical protein
MNEKEYKNLMEYYDVLDQRLETVFGCITLLGFCGILTIIILGMCGIFKGQQ